MRKVHRDPISRWLVAVQPQNKNGLDSPTMFPALVNRRVRHGRGVWLGQGRVRECVTTPRVLKLDYEAEIRQHMSI